MENLLERIRKNCTNKALIRGWFIPLAVYAVVLIVLIGAVLFLEYFGVRSALRLYSFLCVSLMLIGIAALCLRISALRRRKRLSPEEWRGSYAAVLVYGMVFDLIIIISMCILLATYFARG